MKFKRTILFFLAIVITMTSVNLGTVAWFTDRVTSDKNDIQSGNLDAVLLQNGEELSETDLLFDQVALWEPGVVAYENLTVKNAGGLAFEYQIYPNVLKYNLIQESSKSLQDALKFAVVDGYLNDGSVRENIIGDENIHWAGVGSGGVHHNPLVKPGEEKNIAMVIWWEPTVYDNDFNLNNGKSLNEGDFLYIDMGVKLDATQAAFERDSFGIDYDEAAELPKLDIRQSVYVQVENGKVVAPATIAAGEVQAVIPAGVLVENNTNTLTLVISSKDKSDARRRSNETENVHAYEVRIEGVSKNNPVPMEITLGEAAPKYMNIGPLSLYHEGKKMTVANPDAVAADTFKYDPATGVVTIYLASFSEVAVVADTENAWEGNFDYSWYDAAAKEYTIASADQLAAFGAIVGGMNGQTKDSFEGKTVKLIADVNLGDKDNANESLIFYPIGYYNSTGSYTRTSDAVTSNVSSFKGTFDGNGHTIKNFYQNTWEMFGDYNDGYSAGSNYYKDAMGLFGYVYGGTVKNLTVDHFSSDGEFTPTGVITAYAAGDAIFENIAITNCNPRVYNTGNGGIIGIAGDTSANNDDHITLKNITVDNSNKISALWGSWDVACGGLVGMYRGNVDGSGNATGDTISFDNCHVSAVIDVYNDVCANYQYYAYRYAGMIIGSVRHNTTNKDGKTIPNMTGISASGCTVNYGDWNDYYYCEFEKNTMASYSEDYQFSRVPHSELNFTDSNGNGVVDANERESVTGCKHTHTAEENHQAIYLPFHQLFTGYSWGVSSVGLKEYSGITVNDFNLDIEEGEQEGSVEKFKAIYEYETVDTGKTVSVKELFKAMEGAEIVNDSVIVAVSKIDPESSAGGTFNRAEGKAWGESTVTFTGAGKAKVTIQDYNFCKPTELTITINAVEKFETKFTGDFLYRVGNQNAVALGSLFAAKGGVEIGTVTATVENEAGNANGSYTSNATWTNGTIQFSGTGVVKVSIKDDSSITKNIYLEVVDAYNRTTASFSGNSVLLNDVSTSSTLSTSGVIYGNGFTVNMENAPISEKNGAVFHLYDGAVLKNLGIVGKEFTTVAMNVNDTNYGVSAVRAWGTVTIENCYISGCRSAVSVTGTELTIKDSVIANGVYANVDFRSGILNLHNVTTINEPHTVNGTTIVGLGIVGNMTASAGRQINITGTLTQYNWLSQADCNNIKASGVDSIFNSVFTDSKYASLRYTYNGTKYVNTGILSLCSDFGSSAVTGKPSNYSGMDVSATIANVSVDGYVWAPGQAGTLTANDMMYHNTVYEWTANNQGTSYIPAAFDFTKAGLTAENGVVQIEYESGSSYTLSDDTIKKLFAPVKYGQSLSYKVAINGTDYTNKDIVFNATASQKYTITYTVTDNLVYDKYGKLTDTTYEVTKDLKVFATVVDKGADAPTFTFYYGTNGKASAGTPHTTQPTNSYTSTIKQVGKTYYIMPNVSATTANAIGSQTVDGVTVYYPIVDGINVRSGSSTDYDFTRYYPVFKAIKISDNGTEYSYSGTKEMPATVAWESETIDSGNGASALNDGFGLYNNQYLCKIQKKAGNAESGGTSVVKFSYTALDGNTYYYYVGYRFYDEDEGGVCVTPDTLVTLADGSKVRIDSLKGDEALLVWNHQTASFDTAPVAYIVNHDKEECEQEVIHLYFDNGSSVSIIGEHVFFDAELNKYVALDAGAEQYIGHNFTIMDENGIGSAELVKVEKENKLTQAYEVVSYQHLTCFTNGVLSASAYMDQLLNIFDINPDTMGYTAEEVQKDIETYGLYTYADFEGLIEEEAFELYNAAYLKIAVGKGYITWDDVLKLIDIYFDVEVEPLL